MVIAVAVVVVVIVTPAAMVVVVPAAVVVTTRSQPGKPSWQLKPSGLKPHSGSQNSPGHHCGNGPGAA